MGVKPGVISDIASADTSISDLSLAFAVAASCHTGLTRFGQPDAEKAALTYFVVHGER